MKIIVGVLVLVMCAATGGSRAEAAAPWFIIVYGPALDEPIRLDDWAENAALMAGMATHAESDVRDLETRFHFEIALFWGPDWVPVAGDAQSTIHLEPGEANQHGRFYPAGRAGEPAIFLIAVGAASSGTAFEVDPQALAILESHGVPIRVESAGGGEGLPDRWVWLSVVGLLGSAVLVRASRR